MKLSLIIRVQILLICLGQIDSLIDNLDACAYCYSFTNTGTDQQKACWILKGFKEGAALLSEEEPKDQVAVSKDATNYVVKRVKITDNPNNYKMVLNDINSMIKLEDSKYTVKYRGCNKDFEY